MDEWQAQALLEDPNLPPEWLAKIAGDFPRLRHQVVAHPACYPALTEWIAANPGGEQLPVQPDESKVHAALEQAAPSLLASPATLNTSSAASVSAQLSEASGSIKVEDSSPVRKRSRHKLLTLMMAGVLVITAGLGTWWVMSDRAHQEMAIARLPQLTTSVRLAAIPISGSRLLPVGSHGYLRSGELTVVAVKSDIVSEDAAARSVTLVAVETGTNGFPQWTVPLESEAPQCELAEGIVDCGDTGSYHVETGLPVVQQTSTATSSKEGEGNDDGDATAPTSNPTTTSLSPSPPAEIVYTPSAIVGDAPTEGVPFVFSEGVLKDQQGNQVAEFAGDMLWTLNADSSSTTDGTWIFSDGQKLVTTVDGALAWERVLPEGAAAINGFEGEAPSWRVSGAVVVIGEPEGIVALDTTDGSEVWRLQATGLESWFLEDLTLAVIADGTLHMSQFGTSEKPDTASSATAGSDLAVVEIPAPLTFADLADGTHQLPEGCVKWAWFDDDGGIDAKQELTMSDGYVQMANRDSAWIKLEYAENTFVGGKAYTFAHFLCSNGGMYPETFFGVYDVEGNLVAQMGTVEGHDISGSLNKTWVSDPVVQGSTFSYLVGGIGLVGDGPSNADKKSGSATLTWGWDGEELSGPDVLYHLPTGEARMPDTAAVQELYDLVAQGKEADSNYVSAGLKERLDNSDSSGTGKTDRELIFIEGQTVTECVLVEPITLGIESDTKDSEGFAFPAMTRAGQRPIEPGSFYCGLRRTKVPGTESGDSGGSATSDPNAVVRGGTIGIPKVYIAWLTVESDQYGQPTITDSNWAIMDF